MSIKHIKLLWVLVSLFVVAPALAAVPQAFLYKQGEQGNQLQLALSVPYLTNYSIFLLSAPSRLVVDLLDSKIQPSKCAVKAIAIKACRVGRLDGRRARFVLDLKEKVQVRSSNLVHQSGKHLLHIDLLVLDGTQNAEQKFAQEVEPIKRKGAPRGKFIVVLDPGHGGPNDVGASNAGLDEKELTLKFARELRSILSKNKNIEVRITRTKDEYMPLSKRLMLVRQRHADMLISFHADWNSDPKVQGIAVYSQSNYAAEKYTQRFLEDVSPRIIDGEEWKNALPSAYDILFDITQRETLNQSIFLSRALLKEVRRHTPVLDQPHRFADFHLLSAPDVPSVLVEMGFMSNKKDLKNLQSKPWRKGLGKRIAKGVLAYFDRVPRFQPRPKRSDQPRPKPKRATPTPAKIKLTLKSPIEGQ